MIYSYLLVQILLFTFQNQLNYSPLTPGNSWTYKTQEGAFQDEVIEQKFIHKKIEYLQNIRTYADGSVEITYFRKEKNGAVYYLDEGSYTETLEIPAHPRLRYTWTSSDGNWKYQIIELNSEFKTPNHTFKNCIAIKAESTSYKINKFVNYYSEGIGLVGTKINGQIDNYLTKWKIKERKI